MNNGLLLGVLLFALGQSLIWVQTNGQFVWKWVDKHPLFMSIGLGIPISYMFINSYVSYLTRLQPEKGLNGIFCETVNEQQCRTVQDTVNENVCETVQEQQCNTVYDEVCDSAQPSYGNGGSGGLDEIKTYLYSICSCLSLFHIQNSIKLFWALDLKFSDDTFM